jgi:membrane-associated protein
MIHNLLDLYRTLTDPDRLKLLLNTLLSGWVGYAVLFGVVYSETGLLVGFFLPGDSFLFTVGVVAGLGALNIVGVILLLILAAMLGDSTDTCWAAAPARASSAVPIRSCSSRRM